MRFQVGDSVGEYTITGVVGTGGMGRVFRVEHRITRRVEAMKILLEDQASRPDLAKRFLREIQLQASLNHPNIAAVHNAFTVGDDLVLIMELLEGESLDQRMERGGVSLEEAMGYARQALSGLGHAHSRGVTHRDVKPANIILTTAGILKLTDFGLAKGPESARLTDSGAMVGSAHYMSPEQVMGDPDVDGRADLYSLAAVLYELATGSKAFDGESAWVIMRAHVEKVPQAPAEREASLPPAVSVAIMKALAKEPGDRFATAEEFLAALEGRSPATARRRRPVWVWAGPVAAALVLAVAVWAPWRRRAVPEPAQQQVASPQSGPPIAKPAVPAPKPKPAPSSPVTIPAGSAILVRTRTTLSTNANKPGETFAAVLEDPLAVGGRVVARKGAIVEGQVEEAGRGGRLKGRSSLLLRLTRLQTPAGRWVRISTDTFEQEATGRRVAVVQRAPAAVVPAGTVLSFRLLEPVTIQPATRNP